MNFEGFRNLIIRIAREWYLAAKKQYKDFDSIHNYLQESPFSAKQTPENEEAYERLMDIRMKLYDLSLEIDASHDSYMEFMQQALDCPDLMQKLVSDVSVEEQHLIHLELMIIEQVADWELDSGKVDPGSQWTKTRQLVVHLPNGTTRTISISQESQKRYWFGMCAVSSKIGDMKMCAGCKVVGYIGKDEQRDDWPKHKNLCKILKEARGEKEHWIANLSSTELKKKMEKGLGRQLEQFEIDIADHPRICLVCGQGGNQNVLKNCKNCFCVSFCPQHLEEGKERHAKFCSSLKIAAEDYRNEITLGHQVQNYAPIILTKYCKLEGDIESFFSPDIANLVSRKLPGYQESELRYLTFMYTCPLTVLFGAETTTIRSVPIEQCSEISIHLIGVRRAEMRHLTGWEILGCRLPKLKKLHLHFIGDEAPTEDMPGEFTYKGKELQSERASLEIRYFLEKPMLYQDYVKTQTYSQPDIIVALDCGFKFYTSWRPALKQMLGNLGCPIIFTEFTLPDQQDNFKILQKIADLDVILEPQKNPFCSTRPVRCSDKTGNYEPFSVIHTNDFICVVKSKELKHS